MIENIKISGAVVNCILTLNGLNGVFSSMIQNPEKSNDDDLKELVGDIDYITWLADSILNDILNKKEH